MKHVLIMFALLMTQSAFAAAGQPKAASNEIAGYTTNNPKKCYQQSAPAGTVSEPRWIRTNYVKPKANPFKSRGSGSIA